LNGLSVEIVRLFCPEPLHSHVARATPRALPPPRLGLRAEVGRFPHAAHITGGGSKLISRNGNAFRGFTDLGAELSLEMSADDAILDGEIVKLDADRRPQFYDLIRRRGPFALVAFDVLVVNGKDVRALPLVERKKLLRAVVPQRSSVVLYASTSTATAGSCLRRFADRISKASSPSTRPGATARTNPCVG